jgi:hypothetical protein
VSIPTVAEFFDSAAEDEARNLIASAVYLPSDTVETLTSDPSKSITTEKWNHAFAAGIGMTGWMEGSLTDGFRYHLDSDGLSSFGGKDTQNRLTPDLLRCNSVAAPIFYGKTDNFYLFLVASGMTLQINGADASDLAAVPELGGSLALVQVSQSDPKVELIVKDSAGGVAATSGLEYHQEGE